jgi:hypothetical protein
MSFSILSETMADMTYQQIGPQDLHFKLLLSRRLGVTD